MLLFEECHIPALDFKILTLNLLNKLQIFVILFRIKLSSIYIIVLTVGETSYHRILRIDLSVEMKWYLQMAN